MSPNIYFQILLITEADTLPIRLDFVEPRPRLTLWDGLSYEPKYLFSNSSDYESNALPIRLDFVEPRPRLTLWDGLSYEPKINDANLILSHSEINIIKQTNPKPQITKFK